MSDIDLKQNGEELANVVTELRTTIEKIGTTVTEKMDTFDADKVTKMEKDVGDLAQKHSDALVKIEAMEKREKDMQAEFAAQVMAGKSDDDDMLVSHEAKCAVADYLRKGTAPSAEIIGEISEGFVSKMFTGDEDMLDIARKEMTVGNNPTLGYFITPERSSKILTRVFETSPLRGIATVTTTNSSELEFVLDDDEFAAGWVGEVDARGTTDNAKIGMIKIPVHELFAQPEATQKMIDDVGFDLEGWISNKVGSRFSRKENTAFVSGSGAALPKGFLTYPAAADPDVYERGTIGQLVSETDNVITGDDLKGLQGLLKEDYQGNARWGMKRSTWTTITKLKGNDDHYLFNAIDNLAKGQPLILLGKDVVLMDDMPAIADGALSVAYADWAEFYTIVDRLGIRVLRDPFTNKPFIRFYTTKRTGGAVTSYDAGKLLKIQ